MSLVVVNTHIMSQNFNLYFYYKIVWKEMLNSILAIHSKYLLLDNINQLKLLFNIPFPLLCNKFRIFCNTIYLWTTAEFKCNFSWRKNMLNKLPWVGHGHSRYVHTMLWVYVEKWIPCFSKNLDCSTFILKSHFLEKLLERCCLWYT